MKSISETVALPKFNGWIRPKVRNRSKSRLFFKQFKLYCENSSLNGFRYFTETGRHWCERVIWIILYIVTIWGLAFVVHTIYVVYRETPIITTEDRETLSIENVAFPAVALCNLNRISYKAANEFAELIFEANVTKSSFKDILKLLRYLGNLYDYTYRSVESKHKLLDNMLRKFFKGDYDVDELMKKLTPRCQDVILNCLYEGKEVSCSEIFILRKTQDGYCCTFNYVRQTDEFIPAIGYNKTGYHSKVLLPKGPGVANGLSILIEPLLDDYYYTIQSGKGWKIIIFNSEDYPDSPSGGVIEEMIMPSTETYLKLDAIIFFTPDEIIEYPVEKRRCIFNRELQSLFTGYTYSDCIVNCRIEDIWQICNCLPFFFPKRNNRRTCDLNDLPCLNRNKSKWWVLFSHEVTDFDNDGCPNSANNESKPIRGITCNECYPSCNDVRYYIRNSVTSLSPNAERGTELLKNYNSSGQSIVHIYFENHVVPRLKQDVMYYWYELLGNIGGICGVFVGFSLISILELIFFIIGPFISKDSKENTKKMKKLGELKLSENLDQDTFFYREELGTIRRWNVKELKAARRHLQIT